MPKILVLEDEEDVRELLVLQLKRENLEVVAFEDAEEALKSIQTIDYQLLILDWMLPKMSGLEVCKRVRTDLANALNQNTPILILTARADTIDKVQGLEIGADDYLTKPFELKEFIARVKALLRRNAVDTQKQKIYTAGPFQLNDSSKKIFLDKTELNLTPNEYKLLATLIQKPGTTFERGDLIMMIQGPGVAVVDRTIDTTVLGLRKKLHPYADHVETVRGFGYRLKA